MAQRVVCWVRAGTSLREGLRDMTEASPVVDVDAGTEVRIMWVSAEEFAQLDERRKAALH